MRSKKNICTVHSNHDGACNGDSGSGLIDATVPNHKIIVGIVSWGYPVIINGIMS